MGPCGLEVIQKDLKRHRTAAHSLAPSDQSLLLTSYESAPPDPHPANQCHTATEAWSPQDMQGEAVRQEEQAPVSSPQSSKENNDRRELGNPQSPL